jgi:hypothetical protein
MDPDTCLGTDAGRPAWAHVDVATTFRTRELVTRRSGPPNTPPGSRTSVETEFSSDEAVRDRRAEEQERIAAALNFRSIAPRLRR